MKKLKSVFACLLVLIITFSVSACKPYRYKGEHADLYTVAVNAVFRAQGFISTAETMHDPDIKIIEEDDYGRVLFYYNEWQHYYDEGDQWESVYANFYYACAIMQKATEQYVYYYEDDCVEAYVCKNRYSLDVANEISNKDFSQLKQLNDWNKPINEEKCTKKAITNKNEPTLDISEKTFRKITREYATILGDKGDDVIYRYELFNTCDNYGRELYYVWGISRDYLGEGVSPTSTDHYFHFAIIFNPDGSYNQGSCITEIKDVVNFKEDIITLKNNNQWNEPYIK